LTTADIPVIAKKAAGLVPITEPTDTGRAALREYFKDIIAQNKEYQAKLKTLDFKMLYTPQSYLDARETNHIMSEIDNAIQIEEEQESSLATIQTRCEERINALDWPEWEKKQFRKGFQSAYQESAATRKPVITPENEWFAALRDLYTFVSSNRRFFGRSGTQVVVANDDVLNTFNSKVHHANELKAKYESLMSNLKNMQKQSSSSFGLSPQDFGMTQ
jgi:hypothetical protein